MPRKYRHIQEYEKEILELINQGNTLREIGDRLGFTYKQMRDFKYKIQQKATNDRGWESHSQER